MDSVKSSTLKRDELGLEPIKCAFLEAADRPLSEIFNRLRNLSLSFGKQHDDPDHASGPMHWKKYAVHRHLVMTNG